MAVAVCAAASRRSLTTLMVANGAVAGNLSPFSSVGMIANGAMARAGLVGQKPRVWFANFCRARAHGGCRVRLADDRMLRVR